MATIGSKPARGGAGSSSGEVAAEAAAAWHNGAVGNGSMDASGAGDLPSWSDSQSAQLAPPSPSLPEVSRPAALDPNRTEEVVTPTPSAAVGAQGFSPEDALDGQIRDLEAWARAIVRRNRSETARFWVLRGLAFCAAAAAATAALKGFERPVVVLSALSALCIAIEAGWPSASLGNLHRRAVYDLRDLQSTVKLRWHRVRLTHPDPASRKRVAHALELLELIHAKRDEVGRYLGSSEANPGIHRSG